LHGDDTVLNEGPKSAKRAKSSALNSKYMSNPQFTEFLKVRGAEASTQEEDEDEDSTKILLDALDEFNGNRSMINFNDHFFRRQRTIADLPRPSSQLETDKLEGMVESDPSQFMLFVPFIR
jgi:hypothetical protein